MSTGAYSLQSFWDAMHRRFAEAILHFEPLIYNQDIAVSMMGELVGAMVLQQTKDSG